MAFKLQKTLQKQQHNCHNTTDFLETTKFLLNGILRISSITFEAASFKSKYTAGSIITNATE